MALPFARLARREGVAARVRPLASAPAQAVPGRLALDCAGRLGQSPAGCLDRPRDRRAAESGAARRRTDAAVVRELPVVVDLRGCRGRRGLHAVSRDRARGALRTRPRGAGAARRDRTRARSVSRSTTRCAISARRSPTFRPLADALRTSARLGSPAAPALARLAAEVRADLRRRAEARARTVPVRLCFPLVACVLPAFALLTVAPVVLGGLHG